jgi:hypothetical protein
VSVTVHFKGGPLGGETRVLKEHPGPVYKVPSLVPRASFARPANHDALPALNTSMYRTEEYRVYRRVDSYADSLEWEYLWVHPAEGLERQVAELKKQVDLLELRPDVPAILKELDDLVTAFEGHAVGDAYVKGLDLARQVIRRAD